MQYPSKHNFFLKEHVSLLNNSYKKLLGEPLICGAITQEAIAQELFHAPYVLVSHNVSPDPVFNYANLKALELFGFSWDEFIKLPSRLSAEPVHQFEREQLLAEVSRKGYLANYRGIRISKNGRKFMIKNAVVWNLIDDQGNYAGQAAKFDDWDYLEG
jgi:MEKHLA domain